MSVFRYPTYKIRIAPDSQKTQGLQAGDIIRRQYAERERTVYSLMVGSINSIFYFLHKAAEPFNCLEQDNLA